MPQSALAPRGSGDARLPAREMERGRSPELQSLVTSSSRGAALRSAISEGLARGQARWDPPEMRVPDDSGRAGSDGEVAAGAVPSTKARSRWAVLGVLAMGLIGWMLWGN